MAILTAVLPWILRILLILVLILLYILLVPWGLRGRFKVEEEKNCDFRLHSFLYFFRLEASYGKEGTDGLDWGIYLFWGKLRIFPKKEKTEAPESADETTSDEESSDEKSGSSNHTEKRESSNSGSKEKKSRKRHRKKREKKSGKEILSLLKKILNDPGRSGIRKILSEAGGLIKRMGLHFHKTKIAFGFDSPDYTGIAVGILSQFSFVYQPGIQISPDFSSNRIYFRGHGMLKGHIMIGDVLLTVLRLFMNKDVRMIFNSIGGKSK